LLSRKSIRSQNVPVGSFQFSTNVVLSPQIISPTTSILQHGSNQASLDGTHLAQLAQLWGRRGAHRRRSSCRYHRLYDPHLHHCLCLPISQRSLTLSSISSHTLLTYNSVQDPSRNQHTHSNRKDFQECRTYCYIFRSDRSLLCRVFG
jgi:hypothetical protein